MRYIDVEWLHSFDDEPYRLVSEVGDDDFETRKLEFFRSGKVGVAYNGVEAGATQLGIVEVPLLEEINSSPEFDGREISAAEFEELWKAHVLAK